MGHDHTGAVSQQLSRWRLSHFAPGEGERAGAAGPGYDDTGWLPTTVPGDVHRTLADAGWLDDPHHDRNEERCAWMEQREWWFRTTLTGPDTVAEDERLRLVLGGIDTVATLYLDGRVLGRHRNMFREAALDVTSRLRPGAQHQLAVRIDPPLAAVADRPAPPWAVSEPARVHLRKAQYGFGWDWGPRLPTIGLWRPVELRVERAATLLGCAVRTIDLTPAQALLAVRVEPERWRPGPVQADLVLRDPDGVVRASQVVPVSEDDPTPTGYLRVSRPQLWWTHDLGPSPLYELEVALRHEGRTVATSRQRIGIRTVTLDQSPDPDEPGTRFFRFVLNGVPVFAKGANWIPADSFVGAVPDGRRASLVADAVAANMTMLRVWGGGIYEDEEFYDLCDAAGVLVWQDFMFACAAYPEDDPELVAEVEAEARYQVRRLRHHACLALWCGGNENQMIHDAYHWELIGDRVPGSLYYEEILPAVVAELDGSTPYWPGSPFGGNDHNAMEQGNRHNWDVWHGGWPRRFGERFERVNTPESVSFRRYAEDTGRFISEFGLHAPPVRETLERVLPADQLFHHSPAMDHHNKDNPKNKADNLMAGSTGLPTDLEEYLDYGMLAQAEGLKFGIEHYRRRRPHCSGALVWQLNDVWPCLSWSLIDHNGFGKAGYFAVGRAFAPVLASFAERPDGTVELWVTNDGRQPVHDVLEVALSDFWGKTFHSEQHHVEVAALSSRPVASWPAGQLDGGLDRVLTVRSTQHRVPANRHLFAAVKDLELPRATVAVTPSLLPDGRLALDLTSASFALAVALSCPDEQVRYSDNYLDLRPGETHRVELRHPNRRLDADEVTVRPLLTRSTSG